MLIGELVPEALRYLRNNPLSPALSEFDHVIVDEYQDLNRAEQEIVDQLSQSGDTAIVGDSDRSIYSFRHANPDGIDDFPNRNPTTHDESLIECRRCPTRVVALANQLILNNHGPGSHPRIQPMSGNPQGEIHVTQWANPASEAAGVVRYIDNLISTRNYSPGDILVLTPRRVLAYEIRDMLDHQDIPVYSFYPEEALEEPSGQEALALLLLLSNREDRVALRWWLGHESSSGLSGSYHRLRTYCESSDISPWCALESIDCGTLTLPGVSHLVRRFRELKKVLSDLSQLSVSDLIDTLLPDGDDTLAPLRDIALASCSESIEDLFEYIRAHVTHPEVPEGDFVRIMSLQKSKGLTSKVVIVTSCVEGLIPFVSANVSGQAHDSIVREQRRLFYVAVTRCTEILVLSSFIRIDLGLAMTIGAEVQGGGDRSRRTIASRFIGELGATAPYSRAGPDWEDSCYSDPGLAP
jgi:superfamily I DNA/RNA helicase